MSETGRCLTADELVDYLERIPGDQTAERKSSQTVVVTLERPSTNIPERMIGLGWSQKLITEQGHRLVYIKDGSSDAQHQIKMNHKAISGYRPPNERTTEGN